MVGLGEAQSTAVFANPLKAGATVVTVGPVVSVSLFRLFTEILSRLFGGQWQW